jgi:pullulanase/glycogen debranching enzyme
MKTNNKKDYDRHLLTPKHIKLTTPYDFGTESYKKNDNDFICLVCDKLYKSRVGLWKHKKLCQENNNNESIINSNTNTTSLSSQITPELILTVLEQNKELTNLVVEQNKTIMELAKNGQGNTIISNNNNINSHNKTFNLQFFLNETCKDAMNITDFVDSLKLQLSDLENVGKVGFVEGISSIIVKNLQALDVHKRPVHCTDKKRETMYIKDEDKWEKDTEEKNKMRKVIKKVACKNQRLLSKYKEEHPGCNYSESKFSDQYSKIVIEAMGGVGNNDIEKEDKIIQKIAKEVVIDKTIE